MKQYAFVLLASLLSLGLRFGFVLPTPAHADNLYASVRGTVVDPSGAFVPDAKPTATSDLGKSWRARFTDPINVSISAKGTIQN